MSTLSTDNLPLIFCAIDTPDPARARDLAEDMSKTGCGIKIGLEFFSHNGPQGVRDLRESCPALPLFLDLKFHDIPNTVAGAVRSTIALQPAFLNVHASGGADMMRAARNSAEEEAARQNLPVPRLLAVTILTSLTDNDLEMIGYGTRAEALVPEMAMLAQKSGMDGVVCSAREITAIRSACGPDFALMVPGIRPAGSASGDQKRIMTPGEAVHLGASHLVIGRPITSASSPALAAREIIEEIGQTRPVDKNAPRAGA